MKRSESMLVYAVTAVLVVIVLVAVMFGGNADPALAGDRSADAGKQAIDLDEIMDVSDGDAPADPSGAAADPATPGAGAEPPAEEPVEPPPSVERVLGPYDVQRMGERAYRVIVVRRGDTFSQIVERWTGSLSRRAEIEALNEHIDADDLRPGQEICVPWVDDAILLAAAEERRPLRRSVGALDVPLRTGTGEIAAPAPDPAAPSPAADIATGGSEYVLKAGETLWEVAAQRVGRAAATAYVEQIVAANPSIRDAGRVRQGQKILLPAR